MSTDLVGWLRTQLDIDEASDWPHRPTCQSRRSMPLPASHPFAGPMSCDCDAATRWIAEVEAKRRIVDYFADDAALSSPKAKGMSRDGWLLRLSAARFTIKVLAQPYADRPGFREEWRP